jgi:hypothetical protein
VGVVRHAADQWRASSVTGVFLAPNAIGGRSECARPKAVDWRHIPGRNDTSVSRRYIEISSTFLRMGDSINIGEAAGATDKEVWP